MYLSMSSYISQYLLSYVFLLASKNHGLLKPLGRFRLHLPGKFSILWKAWELVAMRIHNLYIYITYISHIGSMYSMYIYLPLVEFYYGKCGEMYDMWRVYYVDTKIYLKIDVMLEFAQSWKQKQKNTKRKTSLK